MTSADLERLDELRKETNKLRSRLESLRNASEVSAVNYSGTGVGSGTGDPVAEAACSAADIKRRIAENQVRMGDILDSVTKAQVRKVLRLYYIHGRSYTEIANELHYSDRTGPYHVIQRFRNNVLPKVRNTGN